MCDYANIGNQSVPYASLIQGGLGIASSIGRASAQASTNAASNAAVTANYNSQINQLGVQQQQIQQQAAQQTSALQLQTLQKRAQLQTAMGEYGTAGGNTAAQENQALTNSSAEAQTTVNTNKQNALTQTASEAAMYAAQANARMRSDSISWGDLGLQIAGNLGSAFEGATKRKV